MNLRTVGVIARKELKDVLRDRRTLFFMMLLPVVVMPVLFIGMAKFVASQTEARKERVLQIAVTPEGETTLRALARSWHNAYDRSLLLVAGQLGLELAGGVEGLARQVAEGSGPAGSAEPAGPGLLTRAMTASRNLDPAWRQLFDDLGAVDSFVQQSRFVRFDELPAAGTLAEGVAIPEGLPPELAGSRVTHAVQEKAVDAALAVPPDALLTLQEGGAAVPAAILYDSSQSLSKEAYERFSGFLRAVNRQALAERLRERHLSPDFAEPVDLRKANVATASRQLQAVLGGIIPYLLFAFCFFGAMYPALDVTAGEKERFTLETLLLGPVSRLEIASGKFLVVFLAAVVAALLSTTSMVLTITKGVLPAEAVSAFEIEFQPLALVLTGSLMLPVAALYASLLLAVGLYARSFKEAQSYTVPLQFILLLPMLVSFLPDVEAEAHLAWIPFVNIAMLMRELLKGNYLWGFYAITLVSTLLITVASLLFCAWQFRREKVLLRS